MNPVPGWYPDFTDKTLLRWWDGTQWTAYTQPMDAVQQQTAPPSAPGSGPLWTEELLFVAPTLPPETYSDGESIRDRFTYYLQDGRPAGTVDDAKDIANLGDFHLSDADGSPLLPVTQVGGIVKPRYRVGEFDPEVEIHVESSVFKRNTAGIYVDGQRTWKLRGESYSSDRNDITDASGQQIARVLKNGTTDNVNDKRFAWIPNRDEAWLLERPRGLAEPLATSLIVMLFVAANHLT